MNERIRLFIVALVMPLLILVFTSTLKAQDLAYNPQVTEKCIASMPFEEQLSCVGKAAANCMEINEGGDTTFGMAGCTDQERAWWDGQLNIAYQQTLELEAQDDERNKDLAYAPQKVPALKAMQRAWITYRDALCEHEAVQWGGGTGTGPAVLNCLMHETARQTQVLQQRLRDYR